MNPRLLAGLLIGVTIISACGQADEGLQSDALGATSPNVTATSLLPEPTTVSITPTVKVGPTADIGIDIDPAQMVAAAIEYSEWREAIVSGEPEALLAVPGTAESIRQMGLNIGNWDPTCRRPIYLVILKGDFDGSNLFVIPTDERELPGQYVAYVFDLSAGVPGNVTVTILSRDGAVFKQALGDPELPEPEDSTVPEPSPPYPPCEGITVPGSPGTLPTTSP